MQSGVKPVWHHPPKELHLLSGLVFMVNEIIFSTEAKSVSPCRKEFRNRK
jgi:hypothetical protein